MKKQGSLLLVDDDRHLLDSMSSWLREQGYEVDGAVSLAQAQERLGRRRYDAVLADICLQDGDGFDLLRWIKDRDLKAAVLLITGYATPDTGVAALRAGAFDLLTKPLIDEELEMAIARALAQKKVLAENEQLKAQLDLKFGLENVIGRDHRMQKMFDIIDSIADTRATVLITGENGTGKSMVARAIHRRSSRRDKPFVEVACGALPETLLESELFGHVAGAFTGASMEKAGKFLQADKGTIFLDEIGNASPGMQVKLLRVLQEFEFEQVGGAKTFHVDARVILATNEDLNRAVAEGRFRLDLFYRINVINIELPPLRERIGDIPLLARHFLGQIGVETGRSVASIDEDALGALQRYSWPGNVRELQNAIERAVLLGKEEVIRLHDLPAHIVAGVAPSTPVAAGAARASASHRLKEALAAPERQIILEVLREHHWNRNATADALGINRTTLYKKMKRLGLEEPHIQK